MDLKRILVLNYKYPPLGGGAAKAFAHLGSGIMVLTSLFLGLSEEKLTVSKRRFVCHS